MMKRTGSTASRGSTTSGKTNSGSSSRKGSLASRMFKRSTTSAAVAAQVDVSPGEQCETLSLVTVRKHEDVEGDVRDIVIDLPRGVNFTVLAVGSNRRIQIQTGDIIGWISTKTKANEPLIMKRSSFLTEALEDFEVGGRHEVKKTLTVRASEDLESDVVGELQPGSLVEILQLGQTNGRRVRVRGEGCEGWISVATKGGELLIGKVTGPGEPRGGWFSGPKASKVQAILEASRAGDLETVRKIADSKSTMGRKSMNYLNVSDIRGKTPLIYAAAFGHTHIVDFLCSRGEVRVNATDDTNKTALHHACKRSKTRQSAADRTQADVVVRLLRRGVNMEARDHNGGTALMLSAANGDADVTQELLKASAKIHVRDYDGNMPLDYAASFNHTDMIALLKKHGALEASACSKPAEDDGNDWGVSSVCSDMVNSLSLGMTELRKTLSTALAGEEALNAPKRIANGAKRTEKEAQRVENKGEIIRDATKVQGSKRTENAVNGVKRMENEDEMMPDVPKANGATQVNGAKRVEHEAQRMPDAPKVNGVKRIEEDEVLGADLMEDDGELMLDAPKLHGVRRKSKLGKGILEMISAADEPTESVSMQALIPVAPDEIEEISEKEREEQKLELLLQSAEAASVEELEQAIRLATAAGVDGPLIEKARAHIQQKQRKAQAHQKLHEAIESRDVGRLKAAIEEAESAGMGATHVDAAREVLRDEEPKQEARAQLTMAAEMGDMKLITAAISQARAVGLPAVEVAKYTELMVQLGDRQRIEETLMKAAEEKDVMGLKAAIKAAKEQDADPAKIAHAEEVLSIEEPKMLARRQLLNCCAEPTKEGLSAAIDKALQVGLGEKDIKDARAMLEAILERQRIMEELERILAQAKAMVSTDVDELKETETALASAVQAARTAGIEESSLTESANRRKKIHNQIEDIKGAIRVFCRVRPISKKEINQGDHQITEKVDDVTIKVLEHKFAFDAIFDPGTQEEVFEDCKDLCQSALDGYNVTMFAYGQTGAGKTFTMTGVKGNEGTSPRTINELYRLMEESSAFYTYTVMGSIMELYQQSLVDLVAKYRRKGAPPPKEEELNIRSDRSGQVVIENLIEEEVRTAAELEKLWERGVNARTVKATSMNAESSRSHTIVQIKLISVNKETGQKAHGKVLIVDLAGSERLKKSQVTNEMAKEAIEINMSLTSLGDVLSALTRNEKVIPYRNHKLTQLMQDSLGGSAKTLMFVNCSPANSNSDETIMSLKWAARVKKVQNEGTGGKKKGKK